MAKKINLSKGLSGRLVGSMAGGAASAAWDKWVNPLLGAELAQYSNYVKIAAGAVLPAIVKNNQLVTTVGDSMMAIAADRIVSGWLGDGVAAPAPVTAGISPLVNGRRFNNAARYIPTNKDNNGSKVG